MLLSYSLTNHGAPLLVCPKASVPLAQAAKAARQQVDHSVSCGVADQENNKAANVATALQCDDGVQALAWQP